jgi:TRAP-type C4-dicarboxylate transport system substrate-binding protein
MSRYTLIWSFWTALLILSLPFHVKAQEVHELRIATLAPEGSSWMRVFNAWSQSLEQATSGQVKLRFYAGGSQGDERDFVRKMNSGQLDGAAVTTTGLGMVVKPVLVLALPGLFDDYAQIDKVRKRLASEFDKEFEKAGYKLLGWGDVGRQRFFATKQVQKPSDLKSLKPWAWRDDLIFTEVLKAAGANPVQLSVPEVYPALQTGMINGLPASALAAVSLQWYTKLKYVSQQSSGFIVGATLIKKEKFDALSSEHQEALMSTSKRAHRLLARNIRRDDERAYQTILNRGIKEVDLSAHQKEWDELFKKARNRMAGRVFPKTLLKRVEKVLGN